MAHLRRPRGSRSRHYNNPCRVFVGNISYRIKEPELKEFFSDFGAVVSCEVVRDQIKGWSRGIAFVTFKEAESAQMALDAPEHKLVLDGRTMHTSRPKKPKRQKAAQILNGKAEKCESEEELEQPKKEPASPPPAPDVRAIELTDDILHIIFSYLELKDRIRIERVCRQWYRVAKQWWKSAKNIHFHNTFRKFKNDLTDDILHSILKRGCHELRSLDLSASPNCLTNYSLELIGMYCPNLESLDISGVNVTQTSFKQLTTSCLKVKWLRANGTHHIGEKCLWWAMHNCTELEYLDLSKNKRISGQCFYVAGDRLHTVLLSESSVTDAGLILLTQHSSRLTCLDVSQCDQLSGGSIRSIAENCHQLSELYLAGPSVNVKTSDLISLGNLKELEILKLSKQIACRDEVLSTVARSCQKLRTLFCEACYDITDKGLKSLTACEQLSHLNISYCHHISDEGLMRLSGKGKLEYLIVKACQAITDSALCCLAENCLELKELDISGCLSVTNKTLYAFQESLLHMRDPDREVSKPIQFSIIIGGTSIERIVAVQFATDTGANLSLHDLSVRNLSADYDHFLDFSEECWEDDNQPSFFAETDKRVESKLEFMEREAELMVGDHGSSHYAQKAEDFLLADDPALFSDEFSDPEDWGVDHYYS